MKAMTNPTEFVAIHKGGKTFESITVNFEMRKFINSYGFRATRELADVVFSLRATA